MKFSKNITYIEVFNMERIRIGIRHPKTTFSRQRVFVPEGQMARNKRQRQEIIEVWREEKRNKREVEEKFVPEGQRTTCGKRGDRLHPKANVS